jgi:hypothetical protein
VGKLSYQIGQNHNTGFARTAIKNDPRHMGRLPAVVKARELENLLILALTLVRV